MKSRTLVAVTLAGACATAAVAFSLFVYSGVYDIAATQQHTVPVYWLMRATMRRSVAVRSRDTLVPNLDAPGISERGLSVYQGLCVQCHGAPGVAPERGVLGMTPAPSYLVTVGLEWKAAEIYQVVKHGVKMTGMPAWKYRLDDEQIWEVVAFLKRRLPYLSPTEYRVLAAQYREGASVITDSGHSAPLRLADPEAGRHAIDQHGCATCHFIPGITGAVRDIGPPLTSISSRSYIAGMLTNTPEHLVLLIMHPQSVLPAGAMPDLGVHEQDARDIAAYLESVSAR